MTFQGFARTNSGELRVLALAEGASLPAGVVVTNGLARTADGYLVVVFS